MPDESLRNSETGNSEFVEIKPAVNANAEFFEIAHDFGDALELVREAISNSLDADATEIDIRFDVEQIDGDGVLVIRITDNGCGMSKEVLERDFWGLGYSTSRGNPEKIGEKGHGTKIFLRSEKIVVKTQTQDATWESVCETPMKKLYRGEIHAPRVRRIENFRDQTGTEIVIYGYNK
jgi:DNA topoisomerase VI subunit B